MLKRLTIGSVLLSTLLIINSSIFTGQELVDLTPQERERYERAGQLYLEGRINDAIKVFEKVIKKNTKYAPILNELAVAYMARNSLQDRIKAERLLKRALNLDYTNIEYNLNLGRLRLIQGLPVSAREQFEKALSLNGEAVRAYFELGRLHLKDMLQYDHMISLDDPENIVQFYDRFANRQSDTKTEVRRDRLSRASDAVVALDSVFQKESDKEYRAARSAFEKVLTFMPEDRDTNYYMSLLEFYRNDFPSMTRYARHVAMNNPDDSEGLLLLGLGLARMQEYDAAWAMFERALALMSLEERRVLTAVDQLHSDNESFDEDDSAAVRRFWKSRDPLFITPYNERELEHFSRFVEANLRFSVEANANSSGIKAMPGWKTDRGQFFIKYGKPEQWYRLRSDIPGMGATDSDGMRPYEKRGLELWHYNEFSIGFWDPYHTGKSVFADNGVFPGMDFREEAGVLRKEYPQMYIPDYEPKEFMVPYTVSQFRGTGGTTDLRLTYGLPSRKLRFIPDAEGYVALVKRGIFLFDDEWNTKLQDVENITVHAAAAFHVTRSDVFPSVQRLRVDPGTYNVALEVEEQYERNTGVVRSTIEVREFTGESLQISDLLLASNIVAPGTRDHIKRSDFQITANLDHAYSVYQPIYLYYEVYNLLLDPVTQRSRYSVECTVEARERHRTGVWKLLPNSRNKSDQRIVSETEYEGRRATEHQYLRVDVANSPPGLYNLKLIVRDLIAGTQVEQQSRIRLAPLKPRTDGAPSLDPDILREGLRSRSVSPEDPLSHYHLGVVYYNANNLEHAVREYREALVKAPDLPEARYGLALALRDQGLMSNACEQARLAWESDNDNIDYRLLYGALATLSGRYIEGLDILETDKDEEIPELKFAYARLIQHPGSIRETAEHYNLSAIDDSDFPQAHHEFGRVLQQMGRLDDAVAWLDRAKKLDPRYSPFYLHRRYPDLIDAWEETAADSLTWFMDYNISNVRPDSMVLDIRYILQAPEPTEKKESLIEARLTVFDMNWNAVKNWSQQEVIQKSEKDTWITGGFHITLKPGRHYVSMAVMEKRTGRYGYLVRELLVSAAGDEGGGMPAPSLHTTNGANGYPWYSSSDSLIVSFEKKQFGTREIQSIRVTAVDMIRNNRSALKAMFGGHKGRNVYLEHQQSIDYSVDTVFRLTMPLSGHSQGTFLLLSEGLDEAGIVIGRSVRRYSVGSLHNESNAAPWITPLFTEISVQ